MIYDEVLALPEFKGIFDYDPAPLPSIVDPLEGEILPPVEASLVAGFRAVLSSRRSDTPPSGTDITQLAEQIKLAAREPVKAVPYPEPNTEVIVTGPVQTEVMPSLADQFAPPDSPEDYNEQRRYPPRPPDQTNPLGILSKTQKVRLINDTKIFP